MRSKLILALLACMMLCAMPALSDNASYPDISAKELKAAIDSGKVTLIDCNGTKSYENGHIPTAINYATESKNLAKKLPADKKALIVAYCGGPMCNAYKEGAAAAQKLGYTNVKHFSGGKSGWSEAGHKFEK